MALISHPFRILSNGRVATEEDNTEDYLAERIALLLTIEARERPLCPEFGVGDITYQGLIRPTLESQIELFDIPVEITDVLETVGQNEALDYLVEFEITEQDEEDDE